MFVAEEVKILAIGNLSLSAGSLFRFYGSMVEKTVPTV